MYLFFVFRSGVPVKNETSPQVSESCHPHFAIGKCILSFMHCTRLMKSKEFDVVGRALIFKCR